MQRFNSSDCSGSSSTSVNTNGQGGVLTLQNPTNNGNTFNDGDGGTLTFVSDNQFTTVSDVTETYNRISTSEMPSS